VVNLVTGEPKKLENSKGQAQSKQRGSKLWRGPSLDNWETKNGKKICMLVQKIHQTHFLSLGC